jgi:hypothetical protein
MLQLTRLDAVLFLQAVQFLPKDMVMKYVFAFLSLVLWGANLFGQNVPVQEFVLDNGTTLMMVPRKGDPNIAAGWIAKVGSVNERPGITGLSHLFEHMMFKGTHAIGTSNIKDDLKLIDQMDALKAEIHKEEQALIERQRLGEIHDITDPKNRSPHYQELLGQLEQLEKGEKGLLVKDEFSHLYKWG